MNDLCLIEIVFGGIPQIPHVVGGRSIQAPHIFVLAREEPGRQQADKVANIGNSSTLPDAAGIVTFGAITTLLRIQISPN